MDGWTLRMGGFESWNDLMGGLTGEGLFDNLIGKSLNSFINATIGKEWVG